MPRLPDYLQVHFDAPGRVGPPATGFDRRGEARNPACGDHLVLFVHTDDGFVREAGFKAMGCPAFMAIAAAATELLPGLAADAALPDRAARAYRERYGELAPMHRHALALVEASLASLAPA